MKKINVSIFIGDVKEDQETIITEGDLALESLRKIKIKYQKIVDERIKTGLWREPQYAGEFMTRISLESKEYTIDDLKKLEFDANRVYG